MMRALARVAVMVLLVAQAAAAQPPPNPAPGAPADPAAPVAADPDPSDEGAPPAEPVAAPEVPDVGDDSVVLNFEGADVREVIHSLADALGINYQIDPRIQGQVTIRTTGPIGKDDLFPVFNRILRSNGISAIPVGDIYHIIPVAEAKTKAIIPRSTRAQRRVVRQDAFVIEVVQLDHVGVQEMVNILQPFVTPGGDIIPYPRSNLLILTDLDSNVARLKDLIATFDRDVFRDLRARVFKVEHANIEELGGELTSIMDTYGVTSGGVAEYGIYVLPLPRLSSVVVVAFNPTVFAEIERWMKILDVPPEEGVGRTVHIYAVENAKAVDLAAILNELYGGGGGTSRSTSPTQGFTPFGTRQRGGTTPQAAQARQSAREAAQQRRSRQQGRQAQSFDEAFQSFDEFETFEPLHQLGQVQTRGGRGGLGGGGRGIGGVGGFGGIGAGGGLGQGVTGYVLAGGEPGDIFREEVRVVADEVTNSLVILATEKDYKDINSVLLRLDVVPRQVLIEALIAEVSLEDDLQFGITWTIVDSAKGGSNSLGRVTGGASDGDGDGDGDGSGGNLFDIGRFLGLNSQSVAPVPGAGFFGVVSDNRNFAAVVNALADKRRLKVLSSPHIMTTDNQEAHILVGEEVPIVTTQSNANQQVQGTTNILQNIQYRDTGVILTVLPQVNSEGLVNLQIRQEVSQVAEGTTEGIDSPTFTTRESDTTVVVQSGETIVIGGIIDEAIGHSRNGIPFLMDIPVIGRVFRTESDSFDRTELIILLTPHVVRDRQESRVATEAFKSRLEGIRRDLDRIDRSRPDYGGPKLREPVEVPRLPRP